MQESQLLQERPRQQRCQEEGSWHRAEQQEEGHQWAKRKRHSTRRMFDWSHWPWWVRALLGQQQLVVARSCRAPRLHRGDSYPRSGASKRAVLDGDIKQQTWTPLTTEWTPRNKDDPAIQELRREMLLMSNELRPQRLREKQRDKAQWIETQHIGRVVHPWKWQNADRMWRWRPEPQAPWQGTCQGKQDTTTEYHRTMKHKRDWWTMMIIQTCISKVHSLDHEQEES